MPSFGDMVRTRHGTGMVFRLLLHVAMPFTLVYILFVAFSNSLGTPMIGFLHSLVPFVGRVPLVVILMALPSILIEAFITVHSRGRRHELAITATTASPAVQASPPAEGAWGDLFNDPRAFGAAEASLLLVSAPWEMTEPQQSERTVIAEFVLSHLGGILGSVVALAGLGLVLAEVFM